MLFTRIRLEKVPWLEIHLSGSLTLTYGVVQGYGTLIGPRGSGSASASPECAAAGESSAQDSCVDATQLVL